MCLSGLCDTDKAYRTLVAKEYSAETNAFMDENNMKTYRVPLPGNKGPSTRIPLSSIKDILKIVLDRRNHPILIHCNKGKVRCKILCISAVRPS